MMSASHQLLVCVPSHTRQQLIVFTEQAGELLRFIVEEKREGKTIAPVTM